MNGQDILVFFKDKCWNSLFWQCGSFRHAEYSWLVVRLINRVINFSQLQPSVQGGKAQAYRSYVEFFQRSNGGCSEDKGLPYLSSAPLDWSLF